MWRAMKASRDVREARVGRVTVMNVLSNYSMFSFVRVGAGTTAGQLCLDQLSSSDDFAGSYLQARREYRSAFTNAQRVIRRIQQAASRRVCRRLQLEQP